MAPPRRPAGGLGLVRGVAMVVLAVLFVVALVAVEAQDASSSDPDAAKFQEQLAAATASHDFVALRALAATEAATGTDLAAEVDQLQSVVQARVDEAFRTRFEALEEASELLRLAELGAGAAQVSATEREAARAKARGLVTAKLGQQAAEDDPDEFRRLIGIAESASVPESDLTAFRSALRAHSEAQLQEALDEVVALGCIDNLIVAIQMAKLDGVSQSTIGQAEQVRNQKALQEISAAQGTGDPYMMADAVVDAENSQDPTLASAAQAVKATLTDTVSNAIQNAVSLDYEQLRAGVELAPIVGIVGTEVSEAGDILAHQERVLDTRLRLARHTEEQDWDALADAITDAEELSLPQSEISTARAQIATAARAMLQGLEAGSSLGNVEAAWLLGRQAQLPASELQVAAGLLANADRDELQAALSAAQGGGAAGLARLVTAARGDHLTEAEQAQGCASVQAQVSAWISAIAGSGGAAFAEAFAFVKAAVDAAQLLELQEGQLEQVAAKFRVLLSQELQQAHANASLERLDVAFAAAEWRHLTDAVRGAETEAEEEEERALHGHHEAAKATRGAERLKAEALAEVRVAAEGNDVTSLRQALQLAKDVDVSAAALAEFEAVLSQRDASIGAATTALEAATSGGDEAALVEALQASEAAGVHFVAPEALAAARLRLAELQAPPEELGFSSAPGASGS